MGTSSDRRTGPAEQSDGALFEIYVDSVLDGSAEDPAAFLSRHPGAGADLRRRLDAVYRTMGASPDPTPDEGLPFERLGEFRLLRRLGEGGMGSVYEARQESLGRVVALKIVHPHIRSSPAAKARFEREAAVAARLRHDNVVTVFAFGEDDGVAYLAMEIVPGRGLDEILDEAFDEGRQLPAADAIRWGAEIARALSCVHEAGVVHRDVKPSNLRITPEGRAVLVDFGVARDAELDRLTMTGPLVGSPLYAAPEQLSGGAAIDGRTDVYGLGATLYECLAGRPVVERGTVEQVIHRKMHKEPVPLRQLRERIARDLHVVVMKAIERDPAARYENASLMAEDLEAVLAFRPIRARPPGVLRQAMARARAHRATTAVALTLTFSLLVVAAVSLMSSARAAAERRQDARDLVAQAARDVESLGRSRERVHQIDGEVLTFQGELEAKHLPDEHVRRLDALEVEVRRLRRERQESVHGVLETLRRAERLDPESDAATAVRASLYLERYLDAVTWEDFDGAQFFRERLLELDPDGAAATRLTRSAHLSLTTSVPGAEVHAFRYVELRELPGRASPRQVPVPWRDPTIAAAGTLGLRVVDGGRVLEREELIVAVDGEPITRATHRDARTRVESGDVEVTVTSGAEERTLRVPPGLMVRPTGAPLFVGESSLLGMTPLTKVDLSPGEYVLVIRRDGYEDVRLFIPFRPGVHFEPDVRLLPPGSTPRGWVRVVRNDLVYPDIDGFSMEREVTVAEYLAFLNDEETLAMIPPGDPQRLAPRGPERPDGYWPRGADGRFQLEEPWRPEWPVVGVSHEDALAYLGWYAARHPAPEGYEYRLPDHDTWISMGGIGIHRPFVFGPNFRPGYCSSCFSRANAQIEPVMDYPIDESPSGAYDMAGSAMEWSAVWWDEPRGLRRVLGGSWAQAKPEIFRLHGGTGAAPTRATGEYGFRLVLRRIDAPR